MFNSGKNRPQYRLPSTPSRYRQRRRGISRARTGATLIDVATGSMLLAVLLIPSVHLLGKSKSSNQRLATREALLYEADQLLESTKVALADPASYNAAESAGIDTVQPVTASDVPNLTSHVRVAADPSINPASLLTIQVDLWQDLDRDGSIDSGEPSQTLRTQWAAP